jgi:hypothetical protein
MLPALWTVASIIGIIARDCAVKHGRHFSAKPSAAAVEWLGRL